MKAMIFYQFMSKVYDILDVVYFRRYSRSPRKVVVNSINKNDKVLDLCTGTATNTIKIARKYQSVRVTGVDISKDMLQVARKKIQEEGLSNVRLYTMNAAHLGFKDERFDKILISLVFHEMEEPLANSILKEAKRVLKKNGRIIVTEWEPSKTFWQKLVYLPIHLLEPKPYRSFVCKDLYKYFGDFDLDVVEEVHCDYTKVLILKKR